MKKLSLLQLGCLLGVFAGSAAYSQVFNLQNINQGFNYVGYNVLMYGQGADNDPGNNIWNGFGNPAGTGSGCSFGGGLPNDPFVPGNPGNPYANVQGDGYFAPNNGTPTTPVLFVPTSSGNTSAANCYSDGTLCPITVPEIIAGTYTGQAITLTGPSYTARQIPSWIFSEAAVVNTANPGAGTAAAPLGQCVLSNVPAGAYNLYLYGANYQGTGGALFAVDSGTALNGIAKALNPYGPAGGYLNNYQLGVDYVVFAGVTPHADSTIHITWAQVSNPGSGVSEGDFNGLQLVPASASPFFVQQPLTSVFSAGASATLSTAAIASPGPTYQWYETNANTTVTKLNGDTSATLSFPNVVTGNAGSYFVTATSGATTITSAVAVLTVATTPAITSQSPAADLTLVVGQTVTLTVSALGANPETFNWYSNSVLVATTPGTPNTIPIYEGTTVDYAGTISSSSFIAGPVAANCTLSCTVVNSYLPAGVSDTPISVTVIPQLTGHYDTTVLGLNPVGYWPLNETSGNVAYNYSTNGPALNGVYSAVAACPLQQGVAGPAYLGMGPNNFGTMFSTQDTQASVSQTGVIINDPGVMNVTSNVTVAMWVNKPVSGGAYNIQELFGQADNTLIRYSVFGTGDVQMDFVDGGGDVTGGPALNDGLWHLWTGTYNGTNRAVITYLDGKQIDSGTESANGTSGTVTCIGSAPDDTGRNFYGSICDVAFFTNTLTPAQVASLFNAAGVPATITVNPAPTAIANAGAVVTLGTVAAIGSTPITYLWYNGTPGSGTALTAGASYPNDVTNTSLVISPVTGANAGTYYVVASGPFNSVASAEVVLTVNTAVSATIYAGGSPTFSVAPGATSYQWVTNGHNVVGATTNTLTLACLTVAANNNETVSCLINGTISSATYTLSVVVAPTDPYAVAVLGDGPLAYFRLDEQPDNGSGNNGTVVHDYINANNGIYTNVVLDVAGFPYTSPLAANTDPAVQFGGGAGGTTTYSYGGYIPNIDFGVAVSNSPAQPGNGEFSVEAWVYAQNAQPNHGIVTKGYGAGNQATPVGEQFSLQTSSGGGNYEFLVNDASADTANNTYVTSAIEVNGAVAWHHLVGVCDQANGHIYLYKDGQLASSATLGAGKGILSTLVPLSIGAKQQHDASGNYSGQFAGVIDEVAIYPKALTSNEVQNHYFAAGIAPIFTVEPTNDPNIGFGASTNPPQGTSVTLKAIGFGSPTLHYQWYDAVAGTPVSAANEPGNTGSTTSTLTLVNVNSGLISGSDNIGSGQFYCRVSNTYGTTNSVTVTVNPNPGPPIVEVDLSSVSYALLGHSAVFSMVMTGTFPQTNAWYYTPLSGPTVQLQNAGRYTITAGQSPTLTVANVTLADQGTYQFFATNAFSYPYPTSSTASALVVENEPTFFGTGNGWTLNSVVGTTSLPSISGNTLVLVQNVANQANSFFFDTPIYCGAFQASFTYQMGAYTTSPADGFTFCLQNDPAGVNALGGGGGAFGYSDVENNTTPYITNSVAVGFNLYNGHTRGWEVINQGYSAYAYTSYAPVSLVSGDPISVVIYYDGNNMHLTMSDSTAGTTYSGNMVVGPISQYLGSNTALIGFTGGDGAYTAQQSISSFLYVPIPVMSVVTSAGNVVISWPSGTGLSAYVLESSTTVNGTYTAVVGTPTIVGGNYELTVPVPHSGNAFYQLKLANP